MAINAKNRTQIRSALRKIWSWGSDEKKAVIKRARIGVGKYKCECCEKIVRKVECDHFPTSVGPTPGSRVAPKGYTWDEFFNRLFCSTANLRAICSNCHKKHTKEERRKK